MRKIQDSKAALMRPIRRIKAALVKKLTCAGNAVTVSRGHAATSIDCENTNCHEHDRRNHQDGEECGMLSGHDRKLFREAPEEGYREDRETELS